MPVTNYVWDPLSDNVLLETDENDVTQAVYTQEPDTFGNLISQRRDDETSWYQFDGLGSTRELTNASETVTDTNMYDAWGVNVASTGTTENPFRWVGESGYYDDPETGDYYVRARMYDPSIARWRSVDALGFTDLPNLFLYSTNSPVGNIDPSGALAVSLHKINIRGCSKGPVGTNATFSVDWKPRLSKGAPCDGYMIQDVVISERLASCVWPGCCRPPTAAMAKEIRCWEAFEVRKGNTGFAGAGIDRWSVPPSFFIEQCGVVIVSGSVQFYCKDRRQDPRVATKRVGTGDLEKTWGHQCAPSLGLPSTKTQPPWYRLWNGVELEEPDTGGHTPIAGHRDVVFEFNCCSGESVFARVTVDETNGNRSVRHA